MNTKKYKVVITRSLEQEFEIEAGNEEEAIEKAEEEFDNLRDICGNEMLKTNQYIEED